MTICYPTPKSKKPNVLSNDVEQRWNYYLNSKRDYDIHHITQSMVAIIKGTSRFFLFGGGAIGKKCRNTDVRC